MQTHFRPLLMGLVALASAAPSARAQLLGTVQSLSFPGPITGAPVNFSIYLPPGYAGSTERLPVVYHLHGLDGAHNGPQIRAVPASYEAANADGRIGPAVLVFPDGYGNSFWADSARSNKPAETNIIRELIPYVDANYRTLAHRGGRAITGFSMGGFSAPTYLAKFPDIFSVSVQYDGSMATWDVIRAVRPDIAAEIYDNSASRFNEYSPWRWTQENASRLASSSAMRIIAGSDNLEPSRSFRDHLLGLGVVPDYVETGLPHNLPLLLQAQGANSWAFMEEHFVRSPNLRGDFDGDSALTAADVDLLLAALSGPVPPAEARFDLNNDGQINTAPNHPASDLDVWVRDLGRTEYGDTNLDRRVNFTDLLAVAQDYNQPGAGWAGGDFDGVQGVAFADLLLLAQNYGFGDPAIMQESFAAEWQRALAVVPEPGMLGVGIAGMTLLARRVR